MLRVVRISWLWILLWNASCGLYGYAPTAESHDGSVPGDGNTLDGQPGVAEPEFVRIEAGTFVMGSPEGEPARDGDETQHTVTLTRAFFMQVTELTQAEWRMLMDEDPSRFTSCGDDCPVDSVNWWEALAYANALSTARGLDPCYTLMNCTGPAGTGMQCSGLAVNGADGSNNPYDCKGYRLPTEAEWEYAYRAETTTAFYNGDIVETNCAEQTLDAIGWYCGNSADTTHAVGQKLENAWGLHDMAGNAWEWVWDWYGPYPTGPATDPTGPATGTTRVYRGGSWYFASRNSRAAARDEAWAPELVSDHLGIRLVRTAPQ